MTTTLPGGTTTVAVPCYNSSNPLQEVPCTEAPTPKDFLAQHLWTIILAACCLLLAITCGIQSYWKYKAKMIVVEERKVKRKARLEENFKKELAERRSAKELAAANAANAMDEL